MTTLIALLVAVVPGALLGFALPPGRYRWVAWAASPALTLGLIALAMAWLPALGLPDSASAALVAELLVAGAAVALSQLLYRRRKAADQQPAAERGADDTNGDQHRSWVSRFRIRPVLPRRADLIAVTVPSVVSLAYGWAMVGRLAATPGWDAMNHGYMARRILDTNSVDIPSVCSSGSTDTVTSCEFYPLAENVAWAQATHLSGGLLSTTMTAWAIVIGPLALVAGIYAAVRVLRGGPVIAAAAATAPAFLGPMWTSLITGRVNEQTAPCLAGGVALLLALSLRGPHPVRLGLLAGLGGAGIVMMHSYDVLFVGVLALGFLLVVPGALTWRRSGAGIGAAAVAGLVPILPLIGVILGAGGERITEPPDLLGQWGKAIEYWVTDPQRYVLWGFPAPGNDAQLDGLAVQVGVWIVIACLLASPLSLVLPQVRWARPWLLAGVLFTLMGIWTVASGSSAAQALAGLWYGDAERPRSMIFPVYGVLTVAGATVIGLGVQWLLVRFVARAGTLRGSAVPTAIAAAVVVASLASLALVPDTWRPLRKTMVQRAPVGPEYTRTFEWLAEHTPPDKVVAYDRHRQFMSWAHADYGVPTLFGIPPLEKVGRDNYTDRWRAFSWLVNQKKAPKNQGCTVRRFGIEYVVVGGRDYKGWRANYEQKRLDDSKRVTLVHREGHVRIYQVTEAGRACSSAQ
ncbi:DUF6541 family protein [Micromonospora sp. NPDC005324]|uniref:DUF6541 family protein n=1 Tax=Micromonospora sp. NPDC005324 TaxID=3157033 RepID=UPI0033A1A375